MITLKKSTLHRIWKILIHPITMLVIGVFISFTFYLISKNQKLPSYFISSPEIIAQKVDGNNNLTIFWDSIELKNLYFINLTIWNNGNQYIDYTDFTGSAPMTLSNSNSVKIHSVSMEKFSRKGVNFRSDIIDTLSSSLAQFTLLNQEALENNDGAMLHILYSQSNPGLWTFGGRVKGAPDGFQYIDLDNKEVVNSHKSIYILWGIFIFLILFRILFLFIRKKPIVFRSAEIVFLLVLLTQTIYMTIRYIYFSVYLDWY